jgi:RHS repeat-associated protein
MSIVMITTFAEDGTKTRVECTHYDYNTDGIRVRSLHEIDADADGTFESSKLTEYLNDPLNITGYSQVIKQTETNLVTSEQATIIDIIGRNRISQITFKDNTEQELYFTFDGHGSTRVLTDLAGAILELYAFDAYGNAIGFDPSVALTEFLYSGEQFDSKIDQQYLRARYYDPATGRFNRLDPFFGNLNDPQSLHKYLYTHADPVNGIDPNGELAIFVPFLMLTALGFGYGAGVFTTNMLAGSSFYTSTLNALAAFAFPLEVGFGMLITPFTLVYGTGNAFFDYRATYNKWTHEGNGGYDATEILKKLRDKVIDHWDSLTPEKKTEIMINLHLPGFSLTCWDVAQLTENKWMWTENLDNPAPETLTYKGEVYATAEVNYFLWGLINRLAYNDGIMPLQTNRTSILSEVFMYRTTLGVFVSLDQLWKGELNTFETTGGKMLWADYGWHWAVDDAAVVPTGAAIVNATPRTLPWSGYLSYNISSISGEV